MGQRFPNDHPALTWLPRFATHIMNRFRVGKDGFTAEHRRTSKAWRKATVQFMEKIFVKPIGEQGPSGFVPRMISGHYLGHHERTGSVLIMTDEGVKRGKSLVRRIAREAWECEMDKLRGVPWKLVAKERCTYKPVCADKEGMGPPLPPRVFERALERQVRKRYVLQADIEEFGYTKGCPGCEGIKKVGTTAGR